MDKEFWGDKFAGWAKRKRAQHFVACWARRTSFSQPTENQQNQGQV